MKVIVFKRAMTILELRGRPSSKEVWIRCLDLQVWAGQSMVVHNDDRLILATKPRTAARGRRIPFSICADRFQSGDNLQ